MEKNVPETVELLIGSTPASVFSVSVPPALVMASDEYAREAPAKSSNSGAEKFISRGPVENSFSPWITTSDDGDAYGSGRSITP